MRIQTEVVAVPDGVSLPEAFGKDLVNFSKATGASWQYNPEDQTIKLKGSKRSVKQSKKVLDKQMKTVYAKSSATEPTMTTISTWTSSIGLKGITASANSELITGERQRKHIMERPSQSYLICRSGAFSPNDYLRFVPVQTTSGKKSSLSVLERIVGKVESHGTLPLLNETPGMMQQISLFNHEEKAAVILRIFLMLATTTAWIKPKVTFRFILGKQVFGNSRRNEIPPPTSIFTFPLLEPLTEGYNGAIRSIFNPHLSKSSALRLECHLVEVLKFQFSGERSEIRAFIQDIVDERWYEVVFDVDSTDAKLIPIKVTRAHHQRDRLTYLNTTDKLDIRMQVTGRELIQKPSALSTPTLGRTEKQGTVKGTGTPQLPDEVLSSDKERAEAIWAFVSQFQWARSSDSTIPVKPGIGSSMGEPPRIQLIYPSKSTQFIVDSYQRQRKRVFQGYFPRSNAKVTLKSEEADRNLYRVKISKIEHSDNMRSYRASGASLAMNSDITKSKFEQLNLLVTFCKELSDI